MANQQTPNLGEAVSLQYGMPSSDTAVNFINQRRREEDAAIKAAKAAHAKRLEDLDKYRDEATKYSVEGIIPAVQFPVQVAAGKLTDAMKKEMANSSNPNLRSDEINLLKADLDTELANAKLQSKAYLNDVENGTKYPDKFKLNNKFTDVAGIGGEVGYKKWIESNNTIHTGSASGTGIYTHGAIDAIDNTDYLEQLQKNVIGSGLKIKTAKDPETGAVVSLMKPTDAQIEEQFKTSSQQPWYEKMISQQMAGGVSMEDAQKNIKTTWINSIPKDVNTFSTKEPKESKLNFGSGFSENDESYFKATPEYTEITLPSGKKEKKQTSLNIVYGVPGATALPEQSFVGINGAEVIGKPTGKLVNRGSKENPDLYIQMDVHVPDEYDTEGKIVNSNKTIKTIIPISSNPQNKTKFEQEYRVKEHGYNDVNELYKGLVKGGDEQKKSTEQSVPAASKKEWIDSGWTEDQINQAVKLGKIKLK